MTDLEHQVFTQVRAIISNEEQVIGRRGILIPLKKPSLQMVIFEMSSISSPQIPHSLHICYGVATRL